MPLIVTDDDVLAEIDRTDALAASIDAQFNALATPLSPSAQASLDAWKPIKGGYDAWSSLARSKLSGGFIAGAWLGVPQLGDQAVAYEQTFKAWQPILNDLATKGTTGTIAPAPTTESDASNANAQLPNLPSADPSTKVLIGAGLILAIVLVLRR